MLGCFPSQPPDALPCKKTLASDSVGNYGSLDVYRLDVGHIPGSYLVHTGPCDSRPYIFRRDHSPHVADQYICRRGRLSGIDPLPGPDCSVVICVGPVQPDNLANCTRIGPLYAPETGKSYTVCA